ncbi:hypothetical protein FRC01_003030 [Tulasnella sp. 417]|nr:hypothetical protein FRC01_003030 [Tulasnella sp. 417]
MGPCLPYVVGAFVIGLAIRLGKSVEGCETSPAKINATAIILTIIAMRLAGLRAGLAEPRLRSLHDAFLTPGFLAPVMIVVFMTYAQFTDFGSAADIWMFQMFPEFGFALLLDWAHIMTAVGVGGVGQGNGHVRRRRRGGGEANLPNLNAEVDGEWEYVH